MTEPTLFIFPHAGGSPAFYIPFAKAFSGDVKRVAVQYPGANGSAVVPSIRAMADTLYAILTKGRPDQLAFFGHSMGALVAFEVACRFESAGNPIRALFVSSCAAPGRMRSEYFRDMSDDEMVKFLIDLSGTDPKVLENKEFMDLLLPPLRGYYNAIAGYTPDSGATLSCPIHAFVGTEDRLASLESVSGWAEHTEADFTVRAFQGDHFYFAEHLIDVVAEVETKFGGQLV
jgi:surfactin synthase thioesterase subunit